MDVPECKIAAAVILQPKNILMEREREREREKGYLVEFALTDS